MFQRVEDEAAILQEQGGGAAAGVNLDVPAIEDTEGAVLVYELARNLIDAAEEEVSQGDIAVALIAAAVEYTTTGSLDRAHHGLAPFRQASGLENPDCQCPYCQQGGDK